MRILTHATNINFHCSAKEMNFALLQALLQKRLEQNEYLSLGIIHDSQEKMQLLGTIDDIQIDEDKDEFHLTVSYLDDHENTHSETIYHTTEEFQISHEAIFDIHDEKRGTISYCIIYLTFWSESGEVTYFLANLEEVDHPLSCVVQFWEQVKDVGNDVDFELTGCTANEFKEVIKRLRNN